MDPVIIEAAINGETPKTRNPNAPRSPEEIAATAIDLCGAGAAVIHNHSDNFRLLNEAAADRYGMAWSKVLQDYPDAILCPTTAAGSTDQEKVGHFAPCAERGARMGVLDPGSMNMPLTGGTAETAKILSYINDFQRISQVLSVIEKARLGVSIGIYEPGFLRATIAFHKAGKLPPGAFIKFYFFGGANYFDATPCIGFGLNPSAAALDCYLDIVGDSGLPWAAAVVGGDVFKTGMAQLAIERGGGVRIGLEDYAGDDAPSNQRLLEQIVGLCNATGRRPATAREAADLLRLP